MEISEVRCPYCNSTHVSRLSVSVTRWRCFYCRIPFLVEPEFKYATYEVNMIDGRLLPVKE